MTTVIGLAPNERGAAAVHLGSMLARSVSDHVVVATIVPTPWPPSAYGIDAEFLAHQEKAAQAALATARGRIGPDLSVEAGQICGLIGPNGAGRRAPRRRRSGRPARARRADPRVSSTPCCSPDCTTPAVPRALFHDGGTARLGRAPRGVS